MELKHLRNFITIADEGNISKAARKLNMAQPPLSIQMKQLEEEFGQELFERGSRGIKLTGAGEILYDKALTLLALSDQIPQYLQNLTNEEVHLRLGIISSVSSFIPEKIIPRFLYDNPGIVYDIYEMNTYKLIDSLFSGLINLAVIRTPFAQEGLISHPIREEAMCALGKRDLFPDSGSESITVESLKNKPLIIYRRWENILTRECNLHGFQPQYLCINDDARTTLSWAISGLGIGIVPASIVPFNETGELCIKYLKSSSLSSQIMLVAVKGRRLSQSEHKFMDYINTLKV